MKPYVKPELFYESYELSQHIAVCQWDWKNNTDKYTCYAANDFHLNNTDPYGQHAFIESNTLCNITREQATEGDYCYTTGTDGFATFQS